MHTKTALQTKPVYGNRNLLQTHTTSSSHMAVQSPGL